MMFKVTRSHTGSRIYESCLQEDLYWLNRSPFRQIDLALDAGDQEGTTDVQFWVSYYRKRTALNEQAFSLGFDFKSTNNSLGFGGSTVQGSLAELAQLNVGYSRLRLRLRLRRNGDYLTMNHNLYIGPGSGFSSHSSAADFSTIRANTDPAYLYYRGRLNSRMALRRNLEFRGRFAGQIASDRLLFSEMIGLGGCDSIRGYDQRTLKGTVVGL